ncbi:methyltransferase [Motiliproteus sp. MSK22-1]|uniref:methyltransferase n=1 Tax=Motiliproteus sp. MSK22-1 TaxID=1897630 RepID=UPI000977EF4A|nr:methyltransferase [Motiliproteus sp. MSK22-1]OMH25271.1 50S rRNA methyltransferase [Motiliproteus sp. MSK22-1]
MQQFQVPQGHFSLQRYPVDANPSLRAWDAADELILKHVDEQLTHPDPGIWIYNDSFGALSVALNNYSVQAISDSYLAHRSIDNNYCDNHLVTDSLTVKSSIETLEGTPDIVLIKVPKTLALLEDQLCRLRPFLTAQTQVIGAAMVRHIHSSTLSLFERIIGPTKTSLATKKARLIFSTPDMEIKPSKSPYPNSYTLEGTKHQIINHANVFSRQKLDIGTRLFLQHLPVSATAQSIIDLGCGNGIVGLIASERNPSAQLKFIDESYMAVASAKQNFENAFNGQHKATFVVDNCLDKTDSDSADLILNNPPFHQQQAIGDHIALQMFRQSHRVLRQKGELWVIGNRHLGYHKRLKQIFGNCTRVASNSKFVILKTTKL